MKWSLQGLILELVRSQDLNSRSFAVKLQDSQIIWHSSSYIRLDFTKIQETEKSKQMKTSFKPFTQSPTGKLPT